MKPSEFFALVAERSGGRPSDVERVWREAKAVIEEAVHRGEDPGKAFPRFAQRISSLRERERAGSARKRPVGGAGFVGEAPPDASTPARGADIDEYLHIALQLFALERQRERRISKLIQLLTPAGVEREAVLLQARKNAEARARLQKEFGLLTSADVADISGSRARNRAAIANRWKKEGRICSVMVGHSPLFPGFQFDERGRPRPVVARLLTILRGLGEWEIVLWFTTSTGWLGGRRPVDLLDSEPERVVEAAKHQMTDDLGD